MTETISREFELLTSEHHDFLIELRDSGETNMWGAAPYIEREFDVSRADGKTILLEWIKYMSKE
jgi:hypothetical protein